MGGTQSGERETTAERGGGDGMEMATSKTGFNKNK